MLERSILGEGIFFLWNSSNFFYCLSAYVDLDLSLSHVVGVAIRLHDGFPRHEDASDSVAVINCCVQIYQFRNNGKLKSLGETSMIYVVLMISSQSNDNHSHLV